MMTHKARTYALAWTCGLFWLVAPARAQDAPQSDDERETRVRILVNGLYNATSVSFAESSTFELFVEQGRQQRNYDRGQGFAFEAGVIVNLTPQIGVMASFESFDGDADATFRDDIPHPLFFDQPRTVTGELAALSTTERAVHVDFVFTRALDAVTIDLFAGPTFFMTTTEVIGTVDTASEYPFDEAVVTGTSTTELDDNPIGFNAGGAVTFRVSRAVGFAFQARFSRASASIVRSGGDAFEFDAGGFHVGGGIRFAF